MPVNHGALGDPKIPEVVLTLSNKELIASGAFLLVKIHKN